MDWKIEREESGILPFLQQPEYHYLSESPDVACIRAGLDGLRDNDIILYQVEEITFDDEDSAPRKEALENVLSSVRIPGVNFIYLLMGSSTGVKFFYGLSKTGKGAGTDKLNMPEIGNSILKASLQGNFRGCHVRDLEVAEKNEILKKMRGMKYMSRVEGVAGTIKDNEEFQSIDRLVDVMRGNTYCLLIVAQALDQGEIAGIEHHLQQAYSELSSFAKYSTQDGENTGTSKSRTVTDGTNEGKTESDSKTEGTSHSDTEGESKSAGKSTTKTSGGSQTGSSGEEGNSKSHTDGDSSSTQKTKGTSSGSSHSEGDTDGSSEGKSHTVSREYLNKSAQEWMKYCDDVLFPRLDYGRGKGLFMSALCVMSSGLGDQIKLENTAMSLFSGKQGNRVPLKAFRIQDLRHRHKADSPDNQVDFLKHFLIPVCEVSDKDRNRTLARAFLSQWVNGKGYSSISNWISTNELSMIAGLPQREVIGMRLQEQVEFGLNYREPDDEDRIEMGNMVQDGIVVERTPVYLNKSVLDKHLFIAGVTGSGKTTTCQRILLQSGLPFLVIEPAKTEYRILKNEPACRDMLIFTLGNDDAAPFRLNPFELMPMESISSHVDMIKASLEAAFDMEAAEPQIIEAAIYRCYEDKGWDINTSRNYKYENPFSPEADSFPTISDLLRLIPKIVGEQGFSDRLGGEYIGSILAMLQSLTLGAKGAMLNTPRSVDIDTLLDRQVVMELESIRNGNEKALIMGFILSALNEAIRERYQKSGRPHSHVLLVEEAHRLLSRFSPGDSRNKKQGVETFSDMLAEIRKYGESLIIVDQIPNKMAPDVLKNTNTKIIHRIFAQDDKEAVGNTMALNDDQKRFLSHLETGRAVMFSDGFSEAVLVQIKNQTNTSLAPVKDRELTERVMRFYGQESERKIFMPLPEDVFRADFKSMDIVLRFVVSDIPVKCVRLWKAKQEFRIDYAEMMQEVLGTGIITRKMIEDRAIRAFSGVSDKEGLRQCLRGFFDVYCGTGYRDARASKIKLKGLGIEGY